MPDNITQEDLSTVALVAKMAGKVDEIADDVKTLRHVLLEGNGVPPITVQVATLAEQNKYQDRRIDAIESERGRSRGDRAVIWAALIGGGISTIDMILRHLHVI